MDAEDFPNTFFQIAGKISNTPTKEKRKYICTNSTNSGIIM